MATTVEVPQTGPLEWFDSARIWWDAVSEGGVWQPDESASVQGAGAKETNQVPK